MDKLQAELRRQARHCRELADAMHNSELRRSLILAAEEFDERARRADEEAVHRKA